VIEGKIVNETDDKSKTNTQKLKDILGIGERKNGNVSDNMTVDNDSTESGDVPSEQGTGSVRKGSEVVGDDNAGQCGMRISERQLENIKSLFKIKEFSQERIKKALDHYKILNLEDLDNITAQKFISKLEKSKNE
jgi:hypothetical protein